MNEEEWWQLLNELGFDMSARGNPRPNGRSLRHTRIVSPLRVEGRNRDFADAFWPTLYWNRSGTGLIYFATCHRDVPQFASHLWEPVFPPDVKQKDDGIAFAPRRQMVEGARAALRSILEIARAHEPQPLRP